VADEEFDARLDQMKRVLEVVTTIEGNTDLQNAAFAHMFGKSTLHNTTSKVRVDPPEDEAEVDADSGAGESSNGGGAKKARAKRASKPSNVPVDKNLDTAPAGKQSWKDFAAEKKPTNQNDRNLLAVYWLKETAEHEKVNTSKVLTLYLDVDWRAPADPKNSLQVTASQTGLIDTSDMEDIKVVPRGISRVRTGLPPAEKIKK
jgi:hypothetical protein